MPRDLYTTDLPLAPWMLLAIVGVILVAAALVAAMGHSLPRVSIL